MNNNTRGFRGVGQRFLVAIFALALALSALALPAPTKAANLSWAQDTYLDMQTQGIQLIIEAASEADQIDITPNQIIVLAGTNQKTVIVWPSPNPGYFVNGSALTECLPVNGTNRIEIVGPNPVTITPDTSRVCAPAGGGGGGGAVPTMLINNPFGGQVMNAGDDYTVTWTASGFGLVTIRLSLSIDDGATWTVITQDEPNDTSYSWKVPNVDTTQALIKGEVISSTGSVLAQDTSNTVFTIVGYPEDYVPPTPEDPFIDSNVTGSYNAQLARSSTTSINSDKGLQDPPQDRGVYCQSGSLIKAPSNPAVYYCGRDAKRYVFPNQLVFFSWFDDFSSVVTISAEELAMIPLGGNVTYRPGKRMIKIQSDPKTYAIARGGILRWVSSEAVAQALYGPNWNQFIDDVNVAFFLNYTIGDPITEDDLGL